MNPLYYAKVNSLDNRRKKKKDKENDLLELDSGALLIETPLGLPYRVEMAAQALSRHSLLSLLPATRSTGPDTPQTACVAAALTRHRPP